jgi:hypothetical protein
LKATGKVLKQQHDKGISINVVEKLRVRAVFRIATLSEGNYGDARHIASDAPRAKFFL